MRSSIRITTEMLAPLPTPVRNWLKAIGLIGKEPIQAVFLKQAGLMKLKPGQKKWIPAEADQYVTTESPSFLWKVKIRMAPFLPVTGQDVFAQGKGSLQIRLASLFPIVRVEGNRKVNESSLQRYLLELPWYPSAALAPYLQWEGIDPHTAKVTMRDHETTGSAYFHFGEDGHLLKVSAFRYKDGGLDAEPLECIGQVKEKQVRQGIWVPTKMDVSWVLPEGLFTWYRIEIRDIVFHPPASLQPF